MLPIRDNVPARNPPIATRLLILVNAIVFLFELTLSPSELEGVFHVFGIVPARFTHPDWAISAGLPLNGYWPFLTSMFLHGGWLHIIGNMWALWIFGDNVEDRMGPIRFVIFYLLSGFVAGAVHVLTNADSTLPTVGASGAIAGVMRAIHLTDPKVPLDIVLHTPGGLVLASMQIARAIHLHPGKVTAFVPHYAMSGGTLIALAAKEIVMSDYAVLGPVDPQLGQYPAASIIKAVAKKPIAEVDDQTLILADQGEKAISQLREGVTELLADKIPKDKLDEVARLLSEGT